MKAILFGIVALSFLGASIPAFAETGECWFIFCLFEKFMEPKKEVTIDESYAQESEKGKQLGVKKVNEKISDFKESYNKISEIEKQTDTDLSYLKSTTQQEIDFYQSLIDGEKDLQNNPAKYYTQSDLVKLASEFYKNKPDGTACDDDRRWVEDRNNCVRKATAERAYFYHDLEWLRYR